MAEKTVHEYKRDAEFIEESGFYEEVATSSDTTTLYPVKKVLWSGRTSWTDNVLLAESPVFGKMLFLEGELQSTEFDEAIYHEHLIHPAVQKALKKFDEEKGRVGDLRVLVLGGGEGATVRELLRYPKELVKEVVWVDIDKDLVEKCRELLKYVPAEMEADVYCGSGRCVSLFMDALVFLAGRSSSSDEEAAMKRIFPEWKNSSDDTLPLFDLIVCDLPDPDPSFGEDGLYGPRFWSLIWKRLAEGGVVVTHCGPVSPLPDGMELRDFCASGLTAAGFQQMNFGMVAIPSFQSEWGFLFARKGLPSYYPYFYSPSQASGIKCLTEPKTLDRFWQIPSYYKQLPKTQ